MKIVDTYLIESLQIYFPASLEIQQELIKRGYEVPRVTPIPIVYANSRGWIEHRPPITVERLINPKRYGKDPTQLGWFPMPPVRGRQAFKLPYEESYLTVKVVDEDIILSIDVKSYHIEKTSIRGINPEKWNNWVMFYLSIDDLMDLAEKLEVSAPPEGKFSVAHEKLPGPEDTYYVYEVREYRKFGLPIVKYFSFCPGCFDHIRAYLKQEPHKMEVTNVRIERDPQVPSYLKLGIARVEGKKPQFMFKLASSKSIRIRGLLKPIIEGKARGKLTSCDHSKPDHKIIVEGEAFCNALSFWKYTIATRSFSLAKGRMRFPQWL